MADIMDKDYMYATIVLTQEYLADIGSVAVESANCEKRVESLIWDLLGIEERQGKFLSKGTQFSSSLEILLNLAKERLGEHENLIAEFTKIKSDIVEAIKDRNVIIHGEWEPRTKNFLQLLGTGPEGHPPPIAYKRTLNSARAEFPAEKAREVALRFSKLTQRLMDFSVENWAVFLEPSPEKSESPPPNPSA